MASSSSYTSPCAACKFLRRKCMPGCIFAPYFPPDEPQKFANVHRIFGASNVTKILNELLPHQREDAVNSLAYEAEARIRDPVYGCVGAISYLQRQVERLQRELDAANALILRIACCSLQRNDDQHTTAAAGAAPPPTLASAARIQGQSMTPTPPLRIPGPRPSSSTAAVHRVTHYVGDAVVDREQGPRVLHHAPAAAAFSLPSNYQALHWNGINPWDEQVE